jgi:glycosyltransferase involved in cell wall biosynthesis
MLQRPVRLTLIGAGQARARLEQQASASGIATEFCGVLPIDEVQRRMSEFDVLVLPSICKDGWGAVVSEALLCGTAVVASHCAGASILLEQPRNGRVVPPADSTAIAAAITDLERSGALTAAARGHRLEWARERLTARAGAAYFERIVRHRSGAAERPAEFYA